MGPWQAFRFLSFCRAAASLSNDHFLQFFWPSDNVSHVHVPFRYDEPNPPILPYSLPLYLAVSSLSISLSNPRTTVDTILSFIVPLSNDKTGNYIDTIFNANNHEHIIRFQPARINTYIGIYKYYYVILARERHVQVYLRVSYLDLHR